MNRFSTLNAQSSRPAPVLARLALLLTIPLALTGCFNSSDADMTLDLGSVSIGQQLMDLESAQNAGVISKAEHRMIREKIMSGIAALEVDDDDDDDRVKIRQKKDEDGHEDNEEDEGFNWF